MQSGPPARAPCSNQTHLVGLDGDALLAGAFRVPVVNGLLVLVYCCGQRQSGLAPAIRLHTCSTQAEDTQTQPAGVATHFPRAANHGAAHLGELALACMAAACYLLQGVIMGHMGAASAASGIWSAAGGCLTAQVHQHCNLGYLVWGTTATAWMLH